MLSLALCMASLSARSEPLSTEPAPAAGFSGKQLAEFQRLANDPQIKRANDAWTRASQEATRQHLRKVAASGDARSLLAASMLWFGFGGTLEEGVLPVAPAPEARAWFDAARSARPRDVLVAWMEASDCAGLSDSCNPREALQFLLQAEPHNAAVQLLALADADRRGDRKAAEGYWQASTLAPVYQPHALEIGRLLHATMAGVQQPPLDPRLAQAMGVWFGLNRPATAQDYGDVGVIGLSAAVAMPGFLPVSRQCRAEAVALAGSARQAECIRLLVLLAADESTLLAPMFALPKLVELSGDSAEGLAWREQLRQFQWVYENAQQRMFAANSSGGHPREYGTWFMTEGELSAMRRLLSHQGVPAQAPPGWLPANARYRALVSTGRDGGNH
ncbi:hypothetical protein DT603_08700 [Pseudoxanthomonas gei]|uniref:Sel1 repeat family protein n=2 Tax=Pseudoxanthomonas gei TaxID=1383030 RepID=A0ABX0AE90_9GAMM|nr:hypothetical protein [Pseudoxanthomonas gei]